MKSSSLIVLVLVFLSGVASGQTLGDDLKEILNTLHLNKYKLVEKIKEDQGCDSISINHINRIIENRSSDYEILRSITLTLPINISKDKYGNHRLILKDQSMYACEVYTNYSKLEFSIPAKTDSEACKKCEQAAVRLHNVKVNKIHYERIKPINQPLKRIR